MLVLFVAAVFAQKREALNILLEVGLLGCCHFLEQSKKLSSDQLGPVEPLFVVVVLEVLGGPGQNGHVFGSEQPRIKHPHVADLAMLSVFLKQTV